MQLKRLSAVCAIVATTAAVSLTLAPPASAEPAQQPDPVKVANPGISQKVLDSLPAEVRASDVHIDASYQPGMVIIHPDGTPVAGQSAKLTALAASCGGIVNGPPFTMSWGLTSTGQCGVFGSPGYRRPYSWDTNLASFTTGCVQGRGFNSSQTQTWYTVGGCGSKGSGTVPWGNVLASPATRARSNGTAGFTAQWI